MNEHDNGRPSVALDALDAHAQQIAERLEVEVQELREILDAEDTVQETLRELVDASKTRQSRIRRALGALEDRPVAKAKTTTPPPAQRERRVARTSPQNMDMVLKELIAAGGAQSNQQMIARLEGRISHDTVRRALVGLRDDERVRVAGQTPAGGIMYAPMPETVNDGA